MREDDVDGSMYHVYRRLSKDLHSHGKSLVAALLRRKLVESILDQARSKNYKYAASDLKLAGDYSENIQSWGKYLSHEEFIADLRKKHARKHGFWPLIDA